VSSLDPGSVGAPYEARVGAAVVKVAPYVLFGLVPVAVVIFMFVVAIDTGPLAWDFRNELYPEAKSLLEGTNPYPHALWPPLAAAVAMPFTILSSQAAGVAFAVAGLVCIALALWLVGVRDWRVYGVVGLWPPVLADIRIAHLTPVLCLLAALVWRYRDRPYGAGSALGVAGGLKFLLWPLGVWLLATGRLRAAVVGALVAFTSLLLVAPFTSIDDYASTLRDVSAQFDQDGYSTYGLLTQFGASSAFAHAVTYACGAALLVLVWRRKSFAFAIAASLVLSPIVWLDFYALAVVPLAIGRPRLSAVWFLPLVCWGLPSSGIDTDPVWGIGRVLVVFAVVLTAAAVGETAPRGAPRRAAA